MLKIRPIQQIQKKEAQRKWNEQEEIVQILILATLGDQLQKEVLLTLLLKRYDTIRETVHR